MGSILKQRNLSVLAGNGLSVAFNDELALQSITEEVMRRIGDSQGSEVVAAMQEIAAQVLKDGVSCDEDFERLVGAFDAQRRTLELMGHLAEATAGVSVETMGALKTAVKFTQETLDMGTSHVLEVIAERSIASEWRRGALDSLVVALWDSFGGRITYGNLNYDSLLAASLVSKYGDDLVDMARGNRNTRVTIDGVDHQFPSLRSSDDFPGRRIVLLHLHGSVCFWRHPEKGLTAKLSTEVVRGGEIWEAVRAGSTKIRPLVVLSSRHDKAQQVREEPFSLAYSKFSQSISHSDRWLVIGYSFRDLPINEMLRAEFLRRKTKPIVLVSTFGDDLKKSEIESALGWGAEDGASDDWLLVDRRGASGLEKTDTWTRFATM